MSRYRVVFRGVLPDLFPGSDVAHDYVRHVCDREEAERLFAEDASAVRLERWEEQAGVWVLLGVR